MNKKQAERRESIINELAKYSLCRNEAETLIRAEMTLHRIAEEYCNGTLQRDESSGQVYRHYGNGTRGPFLTVKAPDRETGALKRIAYICKAHELGYYHQTDPRGAALYIIRPNDIAEGCSVDSCYNRGLCVCGR